MDFSLFIILYISMLYNWYEIQFSPFITGLDISQIFIKHSHVVTLIFLSMELYDEIIGK